jgi:hypothetical protein
MDSANKRKSGRSSKSLPKTILKKPANGDKKKVEFNTDLNETFEIELHEVVYDPEPEPVTKKRKKELPRNKKSQVSQ